MSSCRATNANPWREKLEGALVDLSEQREGTKDEAVTELLAILHEARRAAFEEAAEYVESCEYDATEHGMSIGFIASEIRSLAAKEGET